VEELDTSIRDKRNFLLMIAPADGQKLSELAGFSAASEEVAEAELLDVVTNWIALAASGNLKYVQNAASWISDFVIDIYDFPEEHKSQLLGAYYTYGVALLSYLLEVEAIEMFSRGEKSDNLENFIEFLPSTFTVLTMDEEDDSDE